MGFHYYYFDFEFVEKCFEKYKDTKSLKVTTKIELSEGEEYILDYLHNQYLIYCLDFNKWLYKYEHDVRCPHSEKFGIYESKTLEDNLLSLSEISIVSDEEIHKIMNSQDIDIDNLNFPEKMTSYLLTQKLGYFDYKNKIIYICLPNIRSASEFDKKIKENYILDFVFAHEMSHLLTMVDSLKAKDKRKKCEQYANYCLSLIYGDLYKEIILNPIFSPTYIYKDPVFHIDGCVPFEEEKLKL